ncbi:Prokaryotic ubiquitin-like protein Pup [Corynebacterium capitovis DSM 44611]|uniref:ubiquitin-like protein Pup n=1 Tax=Corynebacterium capitovis TaxID=131081 RepID=UPI00035D9A9C|nr:ubiquitin-like protein Pup [Corynebacterium capitovis]WKD57678.1 Prokaryotic ubiquitin-like protein Pup [Corynebacterium capitovis DSM 44611]
MATQQQQHTAGGGDDRGEATEAGQAQLDTTEAVDLLDEIDSLLGENSEEFVRSYVQKGGE